MIQINKPSQEHIDDEVEIDEIQDDTDEIQSTTELIQLKLSRTLCGERLDKALSKLVPQYSRSRLQQWIEAGNVTVDGKPDRIKDTVLGDELVAIMPQAAPDEGAYQAEQMALDIVYEDAAIMIINKPAGLVVHPAAGNWSGTLLNGLLFYCKQLHQVPRAGIVHRLDKDTSGLMVVAKTIEAQTELVRQLQHRTVKREYLALVWGTPIKSGTVDAAIARHHRDRLKMAVSNSILAKPAVTHYQRLATGMLERFPVSAVACQLETGRTHQIRVHMLSLGLPLVGDQVYGKAHVARFFPRQALHAKKLGLLHPETHQQVEWEISLPDDLNSLIQLAGMPTL
jgi:23S rRNA pseudouridine1911/1915/1917 synthase